MSGTERAPISPEVEVAAKATRRRFTLECSGLGLLTPHEVHFGLAEQRVAARAAVLATAYGVHPERFPGGLPQPPACPT